jgi:alpha-beta hydrolase superfamily lysophospholipase
MAVQTVQIGGFPVLIAGDRSERRPEIVLIHGAFSHAEHFRGWVEHFAARGYSVFAPTLRTATTALEGLGFDQYLAAAQHIVASRERSDLLPVVIGHSLGGLIAQKLAEAGICRSAVLLATAPPGMLTAQPRSLPYLAPLFPRILTGRPIPADETVLRALVLHGVPETERGGLLASFVRESGLAYRQLVFGQIRVAPERVRCPVLCIGGTEDRIVSRRLVRGTARHLRAELREYQGRGHWLVGEPGWKDIANEIIDWIESGPVVRNAI